MYRYGIISTASITSRFIDGVRKAGDEVVCIGSRDEEKAKQFAKDNNINKYYGTYDEVYKDPNVDIVYIPVINNLHFECAKKSIVNLKHVVLEKPFTYRVEEAIILKQLAKEYNRFLFEGVKNLFVPSTEYVRKNLIKIGKITTITTSQGISKPFPEGHWMYDILKGGGAYIGSASYVFHYLKYLFNKQITNLDGTYIPSIKSDLSCNFTFNLEDIKVNSTIDMSKNLDNTCVINGTNGTITINEFWRSHHVLVETNDGNKYEFNDEGNEFVYEAKHIQDCLNSNLLESPVIKVDDSINEIENIEYLYKKWNLMK